MDADPRRARPLQLDWGADGLIGRITIDGALWAFVEWSEERQCWCIEDSSGRCLRHLSDERGRAATKDEAVALAEGLIRDGRLPSPEDARLERREQQKQAREKRNRQPAQIRKLEERRAREQALSAAYDAVWKAERQDDAQLPLLEALADAFDFTDPQLWKSNSWAMMRPRLVIHQRAVVARLEKTLAYGAQRAAAQPFAMYASTEQRKRQRAQRKSSGDAECARIQQQLERAREILRQLRGGFVE